MYVHEIKSNKYSAICVVVAFMCSFTGKTTNMSLGYNEYIRTSHASTSYCVCDKLRNISKGLPTI